MDVKEIPLTRGYIALVDHQDYELVNKFKWSANCGKMGAYPRNAQARDGKRRILMHRLILDILDTKLTVDHINRNPFDNRRSNLRICSHYQNSLNRKSWSSSGYKGVYKHGKLYIITITVNKKTFTVRGFTSPIEAALERDRLAKELHGEFAYFNFPNEVK